MNARSQTDWARLDAMEDEDIDTSDIPALDANFFKNATLRLPQKKRAVTVRLDSDLLEWPRAQGSGYQTRINAILRAYMKAQQGG